VISFSEHKREDIPLRVRWLNNKKANVFALDDPQHITTFAEQTDWFEGYIQSNTKKFSTIVFDEEKVGFMGLSNIDTQKGSAEVFIYIGEDKYRGVGIGKKAMEYLIDYAKSIGLRKLVLRVDQRNKRAIGLYESCGFREQGVLEGDIAMVLNV
jgi:diamine N-acetyltransferase